MSRQENAVGLRVWNEAGFSRNLFVGFAQFAEPFESELDEGIGVIWTPFEKCGGCRLKGATLVA